MAVPKRKKSKSRKRSRSRSHKRELIGSKPCPKCGAPHQPHRVCPSCGTYKGRQVITIEAEE
ncbi:MAG: 50S ribosomal protein L32 [Kiritimatiellae bacterium]|nr:50S ribosomal protein L32 [Kiritimatiellia bacterium]